jgi:hypothetical protein
MRQGDVQWSDFTLYLAAGAQELQQPHVLTITVSRTSVKTSLHAKRIFGRTCTSKRKRKAQDASPNHTVAQIPDRCPC